MHYVKKDIEQLDKASRIKLINSSTGIKPANLIGTIGKDSITNLAIFSSVVHLGSDPALLGFVTRPRTAEVGHTYTNILETKIYTINHIPKEYIKNAHYTSAKFAEEISEFERCGLSEEFTSDFAAPFVKESHFKMGMRFKEKLDITLNGTALIIGEIEHLILPDKAIIDNDVNLEASEAIGISGLNSYYSLSKIDSFPYVRINEVPEF